MGLHVTIGNWKDGMNVLEEIPFGDTIYKIEKIRLNIDEIRLNIESTSNVYKKTKKAKKLSKKIRKVEKNKFKKLTKNSNDEIIKMEKKLRVAYSILAAQVSNKVANWTPSPKRLM